jgi:hypothetical protein
MPSLVSADEDGGIIFIDAGDHDRLLFRTVETLNVDTGTVLARCNQDSASGARAGDRSTQTGIVSDLHGVLSVCPGSPGGQQANEQETKSQHVLHSLNGIVTFLTVIGTDAVNQFKTIANGGHFHVV